MESSSTATDLPAIASPRCWDWLALLSCAALYFVLAFAQMTQSNPSSHALSGGTPLLFWALLACWMFITYTFFKTSYRTIFYAIVVTIPFEISASIGFLPSLSPIDYFCAAGILAIIARSGFQETVRQTWRTLSPASFILWALFLFYGIADAYFLGGNIRGVLRWGE